MAKLAYNKLGVNKMTNVEPKIIIFNDQEIEVCQYLPVIEKLNLISNIINQSIDDNNFYNPCRIEIFKTVEIILAYTNLNVTDKQKEDIFKLYDALIASGFAKIVLENIPVEEYNFIYTGIMKTIKSIYKYKNSILGILENISADYSNLKLDASEIQEQLADPSNIELLRGILTKLG